MGSPTDLILECRPSSNGFMHYDAHEERIRRLEGYLKALEEERTKIEAFKRELPLCMQLLQEAIESSKEQLTDSLPSAHIWPVRRMDNEDYNLQRSRQGSVLEEFIPVSKPTVSFLRGNGEIEQAQVRNCTLENGDKHNWIKGAHMWSHQSEHNGHSQEQCQSSVSAEKTSPPPALEQAFSSTSKPFFHSKQKTGGAFLPFSRDKQIVQPTPRPGGVNPTDLALTCRDTEKSPLSVCENSESFLIPTRTKSKEQQAKVSIMQGNGAGADVPSTSQQTRKARRCWSPELHRLFLHALQQLGGSQVATPKQIRDLMKVEGLTNDEVKSHLQKYRLHTRRSSSSQVAAPHAQQVVVGIWVPPEYAGSQQAVPALYSSSRQALSCQGSTALETHSQLNLPVPLPLHSSAYCDQQSAPAHSQSTPQPRRVVGYSTLEIPGSGDAGGEESVGEDGKSENSSWKGQKLGARLYTMDETEDQRSLDGSVNGSQFDCTGEDETEIEDSRTSDSNTHV